MTEKRDRVADYVGHILVAIDRISSYCHALDLANFKANTLIQDAVIRNLEIIGEACRNISRYAPEFEQEHPELPLAAAYEMRNALSHGYFKVDLDVVWNTIRDDLPHLRQALQRHTSR
ncbi:MAG: DUF86 domain-containing protein [Burkholderiales bacterium]|nr:DUF86 domain-containing protein [Burkholderiales bacterium]